MSERQAEVREADAAPDGDGDAPAAHAAVIAPEVLEEVAAEVGTPAYVYDGDALDGGVRRWTDVASPADVLFSVKANSNLSVLRRLAGTHGIGLEAGTWGEYARARRSGVSADRVALGGVPKDEATVRAVLAAGVGLAVFQAENEVEAAARHADPNRPTPAGVRVLPGIRAGAHPSLETGAADAKFGFAPDEVPAVWRRLAGTAGLEPTTLAVHLGSGLDEVSPYVTALDLLLDVAGELGGDGPPVRALDVGGGLGIEYEGGAGADPDPGDLVRRLRRRLERRASGDAPRLRFEPGRSICARAGLVLTRVQYRRERAGRPALVADAGYSDFPRHVLYSAHHDIRPVRGEGRGPADVAVLGPTCESGDVLGVGRSLHGVEADDLLVVRDAGAYGFVMASNYNSRPRPPEVLVDGDDWRPIRDRESLDDLWRGETRHLLDG